MSWPTKCRDCGATAPFYCHACRANFCAAYGCANRPEGWEGKPCGACDANIPRTIPTPHAKLTPEQVIEIRQSKGVVTYKETAAQYGIHISRVSQIVNGHAWKWLKDPAKTIALLIVSAAMATAAPQSLGCDVAVAVFLNPSAGAPDPDCHYPFANIAVFQKVPNGYLLGADTATGGTEPGLIFLKTKVDLGPGTRFEPNEYRVHPAGVYEYQGLDGFKKSVWAFEPTVIKGAP